MVADGDSPTQRLPRQGQKAARHERPVRTATMLQAPDCETCLPQTRVMRPICQARPSVSAPVGPVRQSEAMKENLNTR